MKTLLTNMFHKYQRNVCGKYSLSLYIHAEITSVELEQIHMHSQ